MPQPFPVPAEGMRKAAVKRVGGGDLGYELSARPKGVEEAVGTRG